jgi:hypothetical protein
MAPVESTTSVDENVIPMVYLSLFLYITHVAVLLHRLCNKTLHSYFSLTYPQRMKLEFKTPQKRLGKELSSTTRKLNAKEVDVDDIIGSKLSSTKLMKIPKKE